MTIFRECTLGLSRYRLYSPDTGVFLSRDFLPYPNKYRAWSNSPVRQVDGDGSLDLESDALAELRRLEERLAYLEGAESEYQLRARLIALRGPGERSYSEQRAMDSCAQVKAEILDVRKKRWRTKKRLEDVRHMQLLLSLQRYYSRRSFEQEIGATEEHKRLLDKGCSGLCAILQGMGASLAGLDRPEYQKGVKCYSISPSKAIRRYDAMACKPGERKFMFAIQVNEPEYKWWAVKDRNTGEVDFGTALPTPQKPGVVYNYNYAVYMGEEKGVPMWKGMNTGVRRPSMRRAQKVKESPFLEQCWETIFCLQCVPCEE